jgi:hypothetical protein
MNQQTTCAECAEQISSSAKKCLQCSSFQDWRRYLPVSSTVLSIMVAFVSVLTVFVTVVLNATKEKNTNISFSIINVRQGNISYGDRERQAFKVELFVTDTGSAAGAITSFFIKPLGSDRYHDMVLTPKKESIRAVAPTALIV